MKCEGLTPNNTEVTGIQKSVYYRRYSGFRADAGSGLQGADMVHPTTHI